MRNRRGSYAILAAAMLVVLLGFGVLVIDVAYIRLVRMQAQNAADAAALAALVQYDRTHSATSADAAANEMVDKNFIGGDGSTAERTIEWGSWDYKGNFVADGQRNAVQVEVARRPLRLMLMPLFGVDETKLAAAGGLAAVRPIDVMVVQDVTGSFSDEISDAVDADLCFLDLLNARGSPFIRIGMTVFTGGAEVFTPLTNVADNYASLRSDWETIDWCYKPGSDRAHMLPCNAAGVAAPTTGTDGTSQGDGILTARQAMLSATNPGATKIMIILSDGIPQCYPSNPSWCRRAREVAGKDQADLTWNASDALDSDNIHIYSIFLNRTGNASQRSYMQSLVRGDGVAYDTPSSEELAGFMEKIARRIPPVLVR